MSRAKEKAYIITDTRLHMLAKRINDALTNISKETGASTFEIICAFHAALLYLYEFSRREELKHAR